MTKLAKEGFYVVSFDSLSHGQRDSGKHSFYEIVVQNGYDVQTLIDYYEEIDLVDEKNYGVTGFSMGGLSSYWIGAYAKYRPKIIAPIASAGDYTNIFDLYLTKAVVENGISVEEMEITEELRTFVNDNNPANNIAGFKDTYVLISHGMSDELIYYNYDESFFNLLTKYGVKGELMLYENIGHQIPEEFVPYLINKFNEHLK